MSDSTTHKHVLCRRKPFRPNPPETSPPEISPSPVLHRTFLLYGLLLTFALLFLLGSCTSAPYAGRESIGPLVVTRGGTTPSERSPAENSAPETGLSDRAARLSYPPHSMVYAVCAGILRNLELDSLLSREEKLRLILRIFAVPRDADGAQHHTDIATLGAKNDGKEEVGLQLRLPDYFERGELIINFLHRRGPPERLIWISNAVQDPLSGKVLRGRGGYLSKQGFLHNVGGEFLFIDGMLIRREDLYSRERELNLRKDGKLLVLACSDILDEIPGNDRRGRFIVESVLETHGQPMERKAVAQCLKVRYFLRREKLTEAQTALTQAEALSNQSPPELVNLYREVKEEFLLTKAIIKLSEKDLSETTGEE